MQRVLDRGLFIVEVSKCQDVFESIFLIGVKSTTWNWVFRVSIGSEQHIPDRQVGEVLRVVTIHMVYAMGLGPLE